RPVGTLAASAGAPAGRSAAGTRDPGLPLLHDQLSHSGRRRPEGELHAHDRAGLGPRLRLCGGQAARAHAPRRGRDPGRLRARKSPVPAVLTAVTAVLFTCAGQRVDIVGAFRRAGATAVAADPLLVKARHGFGSRHIYRADDPAQLGFFLGYTPVDSIVQACLAGEEFSIDVFCDLERRCLNAIPRTMIESKGGESIKGMTIRDEQLIELARDVAERLQLVGPANIQCFRE